MKIYKPWDFCKSINCDALEIKDTEIRGQYCHKCNACLMHQYLRDHGQILEEGSELMGQEVVIEEYHRLAERQNKRNSVYCKLNADLTKQAVDLQCQVAAHQEAVKASRELINAYGKDSQTKMNAWHGLKEALIVLDGDRS